MVNEVTGIKVTTTLRCQSARPFRSVGKNFFSKRSAKLISAATKDNKGPNFAPGAPGESPGHENLIPDNARNTSYLTTNAGTPIVNDQQSLTVGPRGPVLLEDFHLIEKLGQFDREKVPERVVHARGMVAKGYFEVTHDITQLSCADLFKEVGRKTPVSVRFSTVVHEKGSPESLRDVRGFSVKFYTQEGNWDFVGNNIPVFFIRDGMQFPDLVHCLRPNPRNHIQEGWRALDFLGHHPESTNILTWLLDDNGIPANWRHLEGYSVNTFKLYNSEGKEVFCKFHWRPEAGLKTMTDEEAMTVGGVDAGNMRHSHATHDLYNAIADGNYPQYNFYIQTLTAEQAQDLEFDILDCTKLWPEERIPLQPVGKMILNQNIDNFHNEAESIAFNPGLTVPGIGVSDDKLLQSRVFSYSDTQRYRIGVNYQMLPINQPMCPYHNNHNDGAMNFMHNKEEVNYYPSLVEKKEEHPAAVRYPYSSETISGVRVKQDLQEKTNDFLQAGERYRKIISQDEDRRQRFLKHVTNWLVDPKCPKEVVDVWISHWTNVDESLGKDVADLVQQRSGGKRGNPQAMGASKA
jgi:catalase